MFETTHGLARGTFPNMETNSQPAFLGHPMIRFVRTGLSLLLALTPAIGYASGAVDLLDCKHRVLGSATEGLLAPLFRAYARWFDSGETDSRRWVEVEKQIGVIVSNRSHQGDEALAVLLTLHLGEATGESLRCEATKRGKRMVPLLREFVACRPATSKGPIDRRFWGSGEPAKFAVENIERGETCGVIGE